MTPLKKAHCHLRQESYLGFQGTLGVDDSLEDNELDGSANSNCLPQLRTC